MSKRLRFSIATAATAVLGAVSPAPTFAATTLSAAEGMHIAHEQARALEHGEGIQKDIPRAIALYCEAARAGDPESRYNLGWIYANGRGVPRDDRLAAYFFQLAAAQGHEHATRMLRAVGDDAADAPVCMREPEVKQVQVAVAPFIDENNLNDNQRKLISLIQRLAPDYGVDPILALAVAWTESRFNPGAVSSKNAQGLMQLIPETSQRFNVRKPFDPEQNVRGGLAYLRWLLAYFHGEIPLVAAAYNAGEGAVNRYLGIPPYAETRDYVKRILNNVQQHKHPFDEAVTTPSPDLEKIQRKILRKTS
jgi:soluble lytic murein transglycosylase-like protein